MRSPLRLSIFVSLFAVAALTFAATAFADAPQFHSVTSSVNSDGALVVSFDERGLGNDTVDYTLTADAKAVYQCINKGNHHPQAENKETVNSTVSDNGSFEPKNGRVISSLSAGPPGAGDFSCPSGQRLTFVSVEYTNIVLTDTTNDVVANPPDVSGP